MFLRFVLKCLCISPLLPLSVLDYMATPLRWAAATTKGSCLLPKVPCLSSLSIKSIKLVNQVHQFVNQVHQFYLGLLRSTSTKSTLLYASQFKSTQVYLQGRGLVPLALAHYLPAPLSTCA